MIKQAFYYIQKCKVSLGDYASAMTGFQQIIDQNPYSYEGLVASWDYASASLLLNGQGGSGGGEKENFELGNAKENSKDNENFKNELIRKYFDDNPNVKDNYDTKSFTKEDRKNIRENVFKSYETSREKETAILKTLEKKVSDGIANENEKSELTVKKTLNELIKTSKPKNISEHINKMNSNIEKVFGINYDNSVNAKKGILPIEFNLSQNYPNPFNPTTNLEFQIPKSQFVTLKIYDLLGKEIVTIVNENLNTGTYRYKFNGSNLASGVYFYKLVASDFTAVKRMVLVK
ncbi:MAG: T9SS type A sorting domain-containing protein [Ignavibacteria bacterium]|nr:T9SS type A sorting domain-containing protein [Ignavibacteria bacterium]